MDDIKIPIQSDLQPMHATATGKCFPGVSAVMLLRTGAVVIVAADVDALEAAWDRNAITPLNKSGVQSVVIFARESVTATQPNT